MDTTRVLFLCVHNSARSQMAEAFLKKHAPDTFEVTSAGLEPGTLNPNVVTVMREIGIDLSANKTKSVFDLYKRGELFSYVITVCSQEAAERCPIFTGISTRLHWPFDDPSAFTGTQEEILDKTRQVRDAIERQVLAFIDTVRSGKKFKEGFILTMP